MIKSAQSEWQTILIFGQSKLQVYQTNFQWQAVICRLGWLKEQWKLHCCNKYCTKILRSKICLIPNLPATLRVELFDITHILPCCFNSIFKGCNRHDSIFWLFWEDCHRAWKLKIWFFKTLCYLKLFVGKQKCIFLEWTYPLLYRGYYMLVQRYEFYYIHSLYHELL